MNRLIMGLGTSRVASLRGGISRQAGLRLLREAERLGITLIDTADMYGQGEAEELVGRFLKGRPREQFTIASKAGFIWASSWKGELVKLAKPLVRPLLKQAPKVDQIAQKQRDSAGQQGHINQNFTPVYLRKALTDSLKRLQTDYLDIFFLHEPVEILTDDGLYDALDQFKREGLVRQIGLCLPTHRMVQWPAELRRRFDVLQTPVNLSSGEAIRSFANQTPEPVPQQILGHAVFKSFPLIKERLQDPHVRLEMQEMMDMDEVSAAAVMMSYVASLPGVDSCLVGTTKIPHLRSNLKSVQQSKQLKISDLERLEQVMTASPIAM